MLPSSGLFSLYTPGLYSYSVSVWSGSIRMPLEVTEEKRHTLEPRKNKNEKTKSTVYSQLEFGVNVLYPPAHHSSSVLFFLLSSSSLLCFLSHSLIFITTPSKRRRRKRRRKRRRSWAPRRNNSFFVTQLSAVALPPFCCSSFGMCCVFVVSPNVF